MTPVFIVTIVIIASLILVKMVLDHNRAKMIDERSSDPDRSLPASEFTSLIRESVADEIRPLAEKIERLEKLAGETDDDVGSREEADRVSRPSREK